MRENRLNRPPAGRGRSSKRTRTPEPETALPTTDEPAADTPPAPGGRPTTSPRRGRGKATRRSRKRRLSSRLTFTRRALILFAVFVVLAASFASSLRVWVVQGQDLAAAQAQIEQRTARVAELESELARWEDPSYVRAEARERLGWVMPGEVGYRVIGPDGEVLSGTTEIEGVGVSRPSELAARWWDRLATSLRWADEPDPVRR